MIKAILNGTPKEVERIYCGILNRIHKEGPVSLEDLEALAYTKKFHSEIFKKQEKTLIYLMGLFYKTEEPSTFLEQIYDIYKQQIIAEQNGVFTPVQADMKRKIDSKKFFSFSAPTSAGKSYLFREILKLAKHDIVIVVPSRALIAEYIEEIKAIITDKSVLILSHIDNINLKRTTRRIFVVTPERCSELFRFRKEFKIELFLFDEAQLSEEKSGLRGIYFDVLVQRCEDVFPKAKKIFAHPFVENPEAQLKKHKFNELEGSRSYNQSAVGKIFISMSERGQFYFSPFSNQSREICEVRRNPIKEILENKGSILIYKPKKQLYKKDFIDDYGEYVEMLPEITDSNGQKHIEKIKKFIGGSADKQSVLLELMRFGIVIHHGSMPLPMRYIIEDFIEEGFARICFATSTLVQGVNMPFDAVWIEKNTIIKDSLILKNLIGRAGRTTNEIEKFDYGYVIVPDIRRSNIAKKLEEKVILDEQAQYDKPPSEIGEDTQDIIDALKDRSFDDESHLTQEQIRRIREADLGCDIHFVLDQLFDETGKPITPKVYNKMKESVRDNIKEIFQKMYVSHLSRQDLTKAEKSVLSTAIRILLWRIQGKTFKSIVNERYRFITYRREKSKIKKEYKDKKIGKEERDKQLEKYDGKMRFTKEAFQLPDPKKKNLPLFNKDEKFDFDRLVYDTYDYLDNVISFSMVNPLCKVLNNYYEESGDDRAIALENYIRYGTDDVKEIWLLRYGFNLEDMNWLTPCIKKINHEQIEFEVEKIAELSDECRESLKYYL